MTPRSVRKFVNSRAGRVMSWVTVLVVGSIAARVFVYLGYKLSQSALTATDSIVLAYGLIAAWACRIAYKALIQPGRTRDVRNK